MNGLEATARSRPYRRRRLVGDGVRCRGEGGTGSVRRGVERWRAVIYAGDFLR